MLPRVYRTWWLVDEATCIMNRWLDDKATCMKNMVAS